MASQMSCRSCGRAIDGEYFLVANAPCCPMCTAGVHAYLGACRFSWGPWLRGALFGTGAAVVAGAIWAAIALASRYELGILAIVVGIAVSKAVVAGSGGRRGRSYQLAAAGLGILAIILGKGLIVFWLLGARASIGWIGRIVVSAIAFAYAFHPMDLLWYGIAVWEGWRIAKMPAIPISGPHGAQPVAPPISFDTVQPAMPQVPQQQ